MTMMTPYGVIGRGGKELSDARLLLSERQALMPIQLYPYFLQRASITIISTESMEVR